MKLLLFTKIFAGTPIDEIAVSASELGFDGLDLAIRAGQCVNPENVATALSQAASRCSKHGLSIPLVSLEGDIRSVGQKNVEAIYAACQQSGVQFIKLGYWVWEGGQAYWQNVNSIRQALIGFEKLSEKYQVCSLMHTHAGPYYGSNAAGLMHLLRHFDPRFIGAYLDPAHQALDGEEMSMALGIADYYLKMIGVKNARYVQAADEGDEIQQSEWQSEWCLLSEGLVDWRQTFPLIEASGYKGPFSMHATYSSARDKTSALQNLKRDVAFIRQSSALAR